MTPGRLEVITGPMFCGKSEELIRRLRRAKIAKQTVLSIKPYIDDRYSPNAIASHSQQLHPAEVIEPTVDALRTTINKCPSTVIGIDEAQFFTNDIVGFILGGVHAGKRIIVAGLDTDYTGRPWEPVPTLMAVADEVLKLTAVCTRCGQPAIHTQRISQSQERVLVGAVGAYEARCRTCFYVLSS